MLTANNPTTDGAARRRRQDDRVRQPELYGCSKVDRKVLSASADQSSLWWWCHATDGNLRNATVCVRGNDVGEAVRKQARQAMI